MANLTREEYYRRPKNQLFASKNWTSVAGSQELVGAVPGKKIAVTMLVLGATSAVRLDPESGTTEITRVYVPANQSVVLGNGEEVILSTAAGEALNIDPNASSTGNAYCVYQEVS